MTKKKRVVLPAAVLVIAVIGCIVFAYMRSVTAETRDFVFYGTAEAEFTPVNIVTKEDRVKKGVGMNYLTGVTAILLLQIAVIILITMKKFKKTLD